MNGNPNPFLTETCDGAAAAMTAPCVQAAAWERLEGIVGSRAELVPTGGARAITSGQLVHLSASRAGYGKTHLLRRLQQDKSFDGCVLPLRFDLERPVTWCGGLDQILHACHTATSPGPVAVPRLSEFARGIFAALNCDLIRRGLVHCDDDEARTLEALKSRAVEIYDLTDPSSSVGQWFVRNFEALLPALAESSARWTGDTPEVAMEWLRVLCAYEQGHEDSASARWQSLRWGIRQISQAMQGDYADGVQVMTVTSESEQLGAKNRLSEFLRLIGLVKPTVVTVDEVDILIKEPRTCLRLADLLIQIASDVPRTVAILSTNDDLWNAAFRNHLPSAVLDRLTGCSIRLEGIGVEEAEALVRLRLESAGVVGGDADRFIAVSGIRELFIDYSHSVSPRAVLRQCRRHWEEFGLSGVDGRDAGGDREFVPSLFPDGDPKLAPAPKSSGNGHIEAMAPLKPIGSPDTPQPTDTTESATPVQKAFATRLREDEDSPVLDPVRIASLLRIAGQHFPMVHYDEKAIVSGNGAPPAIAGVWKTGDMELLFGLRPYDEHSYWRALAKHAVLSSSGPSKLTIFDTSERRNVGEFLSSEWGEHIDVIELNRSAIQRLAAASDVLRDAECGELNIPVPRALAELIDELEFFWSRVTRPVV